MDIEKLLKSSGINPDDIKKYYCEECGCAILSNEKVKLCAECEDKEFNS